MMIDDIHKVAELNDLCNRYGMDTISVSSSIAWGLEAMEKGLLEPDPDLPIEPLWANPALVIELVHRIGRRQAGLGALLSEGTKKAAQQIGKDSHRFAMHVKGLELAYHDPRALSSLAAGYATNARGGCHRGVTHNAERYGFPELGIEEALPRHSEEGKGRAVVIMQDYAELYQCLKICQFQMPAITPSIALEWFNALTGFEMDLPEFIACGERVFTMKRLYNLRFGIQPEDDTLPPRTLEEAYPTGGAAGFLPDLKRQLTEYYQFRSWDPQGRPLPEKLQQLDIRLEV
jgi:aldehyde:ferredoxin oxidoreductase